MASGDPAGRLAEHAAGVECAGGAAANKKVTLTDSAKYFAGP